MYKKFLVLMTLIAIVGCGSPYSIENVPTSPSGPDVAEPIPAQQCRYQLDDSIPFEAQEVMKDAFAAFNEEIIGADYFIFDGEVFVEHDEDLDIPVYDNVVYMRDNDFTEKDTHIAIAKWKGYPCNFEIHVKEKMTDAISVYFNRLYVLMLHEVGHTFNLRHIDEDDCIMNSILQPDAAIDGDTCDFSELVMDAFDKPLVNTKGLVLDEQEAYD